MTPRAEVLRIHVGDDALSLETTGSGEIVARRRGDGGEVRAPAGRLELGGLAGGGGGGREPRPGGGRRGGGPRGGGAAGGRRRRRGGRARLSGAPGRGPGGRALLHRARQPLRARPPGAAGE